MKQSWTALAVSLAAVFLLAGCNDYGNTFQNNTGATITFLSPSNITAGNADFTLTVNGGGFVAKTKVQWNGTNLVTTVTTDSSGNVLAVTANVPAALVKTVGVASVNTLNPFSGTGNNGLSNAVQFVINPAPNPLPVVTPMSPTNETAGGPSFSFTINGDKFLPASDPSGGSIVQWSEGGVLYTSKQVPPANSPCNPAYIAITSISQTQITATFSHCLIQTAGTASVTVNNPPAPPPKNCTPNCSGGGGGGTSVNSLTFNITGPVANGTNAAAQSVVEETPAITLDGRYVAYAAVQDQNTQVFLRDTCEGAGASCQARTTLLSSAVDGTPANDDSRSPSISSDGRYVAFSSAATNLVANAPPGRQVYLRDTCIGADASCAPSIQLVSSDPSGALVGTEGILPSISSSGRFVAFLAVTPSHEAGQTSGQAKRIPGGNNSGYRQVFVRDTCLGATNCAPKTTRISLQPGDGLASATKPAGPALSGDAKRVAVAGGNAATLFTRSVAVDDRVFLAITNSQR